MAWRPARTRNATRPELASLRNGGLVRCAVVDHGANRRRLRTDGVHGAGSRERCRPVQASLHLTRDCAPSYRSPSFAKPMPPSRVSAGSVLTSTLPIGFPQRPSPFDAAAVERHAALAAITVGTSRRLRKARYQQTTAVGQRPHASATILPAPLSRSADWTAVPETPATRAAP